MNIVLIALLIIILLLPLSGFLAFVAAVVRLPNAPKKIGNAIAPYWAESVAGAAWFRAQAPERISLRSYDGLKLTGYLLETETARGTLLLLHGYRSDPWHDFGVIYEYFHSLGWNILTVNQRAHGESEGKFITYGTKERFDVRDWAKYLSGRFGSDHPIVLDGVSMGCSSVLMALGTDLPENVKGVIADCGFVSPYEELCHVAKNRLHLPVHPLLDLANFFSRRIAGFDFRDYSTLTALEQNMRPVLFVHGERDTFVPPENSRRNYSACKAPKKLILVPEAGHGMSYLVERENCQKEIEQFLRQFENIHT